MLPDSSHIDNALIAKLGADATLLALCPNGVYWDEAPPGSTRFVIVSLVNAHDAALFGGTAFEDAVYAIEARMLSTVEGANVKAAAARIQDLLHFGSLTIADYGLMIMRRVERIRRTEVDAADPTIRWLRRGGHYQIMAAPAGT